MPQTPRKGNGHSRSSRRVLRPRSSSARLQIPTLSARQARELRSELYNYAKNELRIGEKGAAYLADVFSKPVEV